MALLNCSTVGCRAHIDTQTSARKDDQYYCQECSGWTRWQAPGGAAEIDLAARAAQTQMRFYRCPHCHQPFPVAVVVGALGDHPSTILTCKCTYTAAVEEETHYRYGWRDGAQVREPVQMERVTRAPFTITVADLILQGELLQVRPYECNAERKW
jgi:hypothetical protein